MQRVHCVLFISGLLTAICYASSPARLPQLAPVTLFTQAQLPVPPVVLESLQDEVAALLGPAGFRFRWYGVADAKAAGVQVEVAVITFRGQCDALEPAPAAQPHTHALGSTTMSDGEILPFTTIDCDLTRRFVADALRQLPRSERAKAFGRALGRILAHELYHIFADTQHHGRAGVARESYTVADLMFRDLEFQDSEFEQLRGGRAYSILERAAAQ
jgi:hypothetical protein